MATGSIPTIPTSKPPFKYWKYDGFHVTKPENNSLYLSEMLPINGFHFVRFGFKISDSSRKMYCYVDDLERIGFIVKSVTCYYLSKRILEDDWKTQVLEMELVGNEVGKTLLFSAVTSVGEEDLNVVLNFRVCVTGSVDDYICQQFDSLLGHQLWDSAVEKNFTDVEFVVGKRTFFAHKLIITARSPVFKAMFESRMTESSTGRVVIEDVDPDVFDQFLFFLYTGQLDEPPKDSQLLYLAEKYMIKTLVALCVYANDHRLKAKEVMRMALEIPQEIKKTRTFRMDLKEGSSSGRMVSHSFMLSGLNDYSFVRKFHLPDFCAKLTSTRTTGSVAGGPTSSRGIKGVLICCTSPVETCGMETIGIDVGFKPASSIWGSKKNYVLENLTAYKNVPFQMFSLKMELESHAKILERRGSFSSSFDCKIYSQATVKNFDYHLRDKLYGEELWSTLENVKATDVMKFQVGGKFFAVHRFIAAIRCPSLAKLFPHSLKKPFLIENMDPSTFENFLYFLYTGMLKDGFSFPGEELFQVASIYPVETLNVLLQDFKEKNQFCRKSLSSFMMEI